MVCQQARTLASKGGEHEMVCQQARTLASKGGGLGVPRRLKKGTSAREDAGPQGGWIVSSHIGWGRERNTFNKGVETYPQQTRFKNLEGKLERESPKRTISASGGLGPLQLHHWLHG